MVWLYVYAMVDNSRCHTILLPCNYNITITITTLPTISITTSNRRQPVRFLLTARWFSEKEQNLSVRRQPVRPLAQIVLIPMFSR